jgi:eukaryotic-like serine/threonine-protein kinase
MDRDRVADPGKSRRFVSAPWRATRSEEESRAYLQSRLAALWKIMFWAFVALILSQVVLYEEIARELRPRYQNAIYVMGTCGIALMAAIWRGVLLRRTLTLAQLYGLDMFYAAGSGLALGAGAMLAYDFKASHYVSLIYAAYAVFARTLIVPSSGRWTALVSTVTFVPLVIAAAVLAELADVGMSGPVFFVGGSLLGATAVLLAATGSHIIYGLRRQVSAAMQVGQYTLDRKIGEGGMGAVYRAHHILLRRPTAVKLLLPDRVGADNLARFEREVQHMSQLTHPNTVAVFDYGRSPEGIFYYAMEYLGGGVDLEKLVRVHGRQPAGRVAHILAQVCGALHEAHEGRIIHRDIKPANIILCERGGMPDVAKVVDFGLVKEITAETGASTQIILGTPAYVAPEAVTDPNSIGPSVDLYGLGAVGYFLLTGKRVFEGKTAVDVCIQHVTARPKPPSELGVAVSSELEAIIMRCLAKQPAERFATAAEMGDALRALPASADWTQALARAWWKNLQEVEDIGVARSSTPTLTITVDLGHRMSA